MVNLQTLKHGTGLVRFFFSLIVSVKTNERKSVGKEIVQIDVQVDNLSLTGCVLVSAF